MNDSDPFICIAAGLAVFVVWITFDHGWMVLGEAREGFVPLAPDGTIDWILVGLRLAGLTAVVPVMEELFWRSFVLRRIESKDFLASDPRKAGTLAFALSSALFASEHSLWLAGLVAGIIYNALYMRTGNLWSPVIAHAITNGTLGIWILSTGNWRFW